MSSEIGGTNGNGNGNIKDNHRAEFLEKYIEGLPSTVFIYLPDGKYHQYRASEGRIISYDTEKKIVYIGSISEDKQFNVDRIYEGFPFYCTYEEMPN